MICTFLHADVQENDYYQEMTTQDKENLSFVINTLSSHSAPSLLFYKRDLEKRGMATDHLHVLRRLGYIFSNPTLAKETKAIGSVPWKRFARDFGKSLARADERGEMPQEVIDDFANQIGANPKEIDPYFKKKEWVALMNYLRDR